MTYHLIAWELEAMSYRSEEAVLDAVVPLDKGAVSSHFEFFFTWRHAVEFVGPHLFGDGTVHGVNLAMDHRDLRPNLAAIRSGFDALSDEQQHLAAVLVCFYDLEQGAALLQRSGVRDLMTISHLRHHVRGIIARLMLYAV